MTELISLGISCFVFSFKLSKESIKFYTINEYIATFYINAFLFSFLFKTIFECIQYFQSPSNDEKSIEETIPEETIPFLSKEYLSLDNDYTYEWDPSDNTIHECNTDILEDALNELEEEYDDPD